jgi:hypothetical protein
MRLMVALAGAVWAAAVGSSTATNDTGRIASEPHPIVRFPNIEDSPGWGRVS